MTLSCNRPKVGRGVRIRFLFGACVSCGCFFVAGCASTPESLTPPVGNNPNPSNTMANGGSAAKELAVAQRMIHAGDYSQVIPRLMHVVSKYPETTAGIEAKYFLGFTYYQIGGYRDALAYFNEYLALAPEGRYAELGREYVAGLSDAVDGGIERLQERIEAAQERAAVDPTQFANQLELADLYWKNRQYNEAGELYKSIVKQWPQLETDATIRQRLERAPDGSFVVLTPEEVQRRYAEAEPLLIINDSSFRSGKYSGWHNLTGRDMYYNVSGQAVNRGGTTLQNVQVIVTIYGLGHLVYDTKTVGIGRLRPGEMRAFSVRFDNFDNLENVNRYEITGLFDR